jgi:hypothetical protein
MRGMAEGTADFITWDARADAITEYKYRITSQCFDLLYKMAWEQLYIVCFFLAMGTGDVPEQEYIDSSRLAELAGFSLGKIGQVLARTYFSAEPLPACLPYDSPHRQIFVWPADLGYVFEKVSQLEKNFVGRLVEGAGLLDLVNYHYRLSSRLRLSPALRKVFDSLPISDRSKVVVGWTWARTETRMQ